MTETFTYSVAIRTLGKAGDKYRRLLDAIKRQTVQPEKVIVVLPEGYEPPKQRLGTEEFVYSKKGMIWQRIYALRYIDSDFTLFCDDDVEPEPDFVEKLADPLLNGDYDCSAGPLLEFFPPNSPKYFLASVMGSVCVMLRGRKDTYVRILATGGWSYNHSIDTKNHRIYKTDSLAWTCFFVKTDVMKKIHMEDEVWAERTGYAYGDDQICFYKMRQNGYKVCVVSDARYAHNDARTSREAGSTKGSYAGAFNHYVFWHRFQYVPGGGHKASVA